MSIRDEMASVLVEQDEDYYDPEFGASEWKRAFVLGWDMALKHAPEVQALCFSLEAECSCHSFPKNEKCPPCIAVRDYSALTKGKNL